MEHFELSKDTSPGIIKMIGFIFLSIFTLGFISFFLYEMFVEPHYWKNRWKLHRLLNRGKVHVKYNSSNSIYGDQIKVYDIDIEGVEYSLWIWDKKNMTLDSINSNTDYIGLFKASAITKWLNRIAINEIIRLCNESEKSKDEPKFKSVDDFTADDYRNC